MKTKIFAGLIILAAVIVINSCESKQATAPSTAAVSSSCDTTNLTYSSGTNNMDSIINVQCGVTTGTNACHSSTGSSGFPYNSYAGIYTVYQKGYLYSVLFSSTPDGGQKMPLVTQTGWDPSCMLPKFKAWMDRGCPQ